MIIVYKLRNYILSDEMFITIKLLEDNLTCWTVRIPEVIQASLFSLFLKTGLQTIIEAFVEDNNFFKPQTLTAGPEGGPKPEDLAKKFSVLNAERGDDGSNSSGEDNSEGSDNGWDGKGKGKEIESKGKGKEIESKGKEPASKRVIGPEDYSNIDDRFERFESKSEGSSSIPRSAESIARSADSIRETLESHRNAVVARAMSVYIRTVKSTEDLEFLHREIANAQESLEMYNDSGKNVPAYEFEVPKLQLKLQLCLDRLNELEQEELSQGKGKGKAVVENVKAASKVSSENRVINPNYVPAPGGESSSSSKRIKLDNVYTSNNSSPENSDSEESDMQRAIRESMQSIKEERARRESEERARREFVRPDSEESDMQRAIRESLKTMEEEKKRRESFRGESSKGESSKGESSNSKK
jgi:hypothetical protein